MKRSAYYYLSFVAIMTGCLVSCQDDNQGFTEEEIKESVIAREFVKNFVERFGEPDPNHTWGMGVIPGDGATRTQVANKNEWAEIYHLQVPGWPDVYYKENDNTKYGTSDYKNYDNNMVVTETSAGSVPAGDVTDEEVKYVSWWFRTHRYPTSINAHWSDFYVQEVSSDFDRDVNGNVVNQAPIIKYDQNAESDVVDNYRALTLYLDQLKVKTQSNDFDHIYNFNSGASNKLESCVNLPMYGATNAQIYEDLKDKNGATVSTNYRMMAFYQSSGTENFEAHYSSDNSDKNNVDGKKPIWVLVHLHFVGASGRIYDGYYLGFDFESNNSSSGEKTIYEQDGYYSNWIVKINPGKAIENTGFTRRVMCEDLGNTHDFDFDDVVFDATYNITQSQLDAYKNDPTQIPSTGIDVTINLQAAGGTMPIFVGKNPNQNDDDPNEAHKLFGHPVTTPVNVEDGASSAVVNYHINVRSLDPKDIGIWVHNTVVNEWMNLSVPAQGNYSTPAASTKSNVPQRFAVPNSVLWLKETHQIETGYPKFGAWAADATKYAEGSDSPWYTTNINTSHLCGIAGNNNSFTPDPDSGLPGTTSTSQGYLHTVKVVRNNKDWGTVSAEGLEKPNSEGIYYGDYDTKSEKKLTLTAIPAEGYEFYYWNVNDRGYLNQNNKELTNPSLEITINKDIFVFAVFKKKSN